MEDPNASAAASYSHGYGQIAFAPNLPLFGVPSKAIISLSMPSWSRASMPITSGAMISFTFSTASERLCPGNGICRRREAQRLRERQWKHRMERSRDRLHRIPGILQPLRLDCHGVKDFACIYIRNNSHVYSLLLMLCLCSIMNHLFTSLQSWKFPSFHPASADPSGREWLARCRQEYRLHLALHSHPLR